MSAAERRKVGAKADGFLRKQLAIEKMIGRKSHDLTKYTNRERIIVLFDQPLEDAVTMIEETAEQSKQRVEDLCKVVKESTDRAVSTLKNGSASMKASTDRVQHDMERVRNSVAAAIASLGSAEFIAAVENAERMAAALRAIAELQQTKLTFAVFGSTPQ